MSALLLSQGCHLRAAMSSHSDAASRSPDGVSRGPALEEWEQKEVLREVVKIPLPEECTLLLGGFPALPYPHHILLWTGKRYSPQDWVHGISGFAVQPYF